MLQLRAVFAVEPMKSIINVVITWINLNEVIIIETKRLILSAAALFREIIYH